MRPLVIAALLSGALAVPLAVGEVSTSDAAWWLDKLTGPAGVVVVSIYVIRELLRQIDRKDGQIERMVNAVSDHDGKS